MRFTCDVSALSSALSTVSHALPARTPKPILEGIFIESTDEGLHIVCSDGMLSIETTIDAVFSEEGNSVLPGKLFCDIVRKLPGGTVEMSINTKLQATIRCSGMRMSLTGFDPVEYPDLPEISGESFSLEQGKLRSMISSTLFAVAVDESRPILTGCYLEMMPDKMNVVALDGFRLAMRTEAVQGPQEKKSAVIGGHALGDIAKILEDSENPVSIIVTKAYVKFILGRTQITARRLEGEYIRYEQILPKERLTSTTIRRTELASAIDRASLFANDGKSHLVTFNIQGDELEITSSSENGGVEEKLPVTTFGQDIRISFNIRYLLDVLKSTSDDEVCMHFNSNVSPCVITPCEGDAYLYLVLPVRTFR